LVIGLGILSILFVNLVHLSPDTGNMRKLYLLGPLTVLIHFFTANNSYAQDFSNKGKDFWVAYGYHQVMNAGNGQDMRLYFSAEQAAIVKVDIPGLSYTATYNVPANSTIASAPIPKTSPDARLTAGSAAPENKGIHITSDKNIVAYAHVYNASVSGATILYPTPTLGKEYYSINYTNISNVGNANCWFYVIGTDVGTTTVEITPIANCTNGWLAGNTYTISLTQGQVFNVMGITNGNNGVDLTGSSIKSVPGPGGSCKRIAVFSGSGRIAISCNGSAPSSDNYMVQSLPKAAWGKKYLTSPTVSYNTFNGNTSSPSVVSFYRICVADPTTVVKINGVVTSLPLNFGFYYQIDATTVPQLIEADKPITVAQYIPSQGNGSGCGTTNGDGDPEVFYLSPVEQSISKVLWNASAQYQINQSKHYINVIIPNGGTAISSFRLDGATVPLTSFVTHPQDPNYSYGIFNVSSNNGGPGGGTGLPHVVQSDSGFNAIAYGYGGAESYGYNAGTNIKDIYQYISIENPYATVNIPATCVGTPIYFSMTFPYQPTQIEWQFGPLLNGMGIADVTLGPPAPPPTSTVVVNGKTLYIYRLPTQYTINTVGTYPIKVIATNPTPDNCGGVQEIDYDLQVFSKPISEFNFATMGCLSNPVVFTDNPQNTNSRPIIHWYYDFGDAATSLTANPTHLYSAAGAWDVSHVIITDIGCKSDTLHHIVTINNPPIASFTASTPQCVNQPITFTDASTADPGNTLSKWYWDFGDGNSIIVNAPSPPSQTHAYATAGTFNVTLKVETSAGCQSIVSTVQVTIHANPNADFSMPGVCLPLGNAQFTDLSTIGAGESITGWAWDFGDGGNSTLQNPTHTYTTTGPFTVTLVTTSSNGCTDTEVKVISNVFSEPQPAFNAPPEVCLGDPAAFTDNSTAPGSSVTQWAWDFGDGNFSNVQNPSHTYATAGTYTVTLNVTSAAGCPSVNTTASKTVVVNPLPTASFTTSTPRCENSVVTLTSTSTANAGTITQYAWTVNGNPIGGNNPSVTFTPPTAGTYTVVLTIQTDKGCSKSASSLVTVTPTPVANFTLPNVCLPGGVANFINTSTIGDGSPLSYAWDFGDGGLSNAQNPTHTYTGVGPFTVTLVVTSVSGCTDTKVQTLTTIYAEPQAAFNAPPEVCLGSPATFTDNSTAPGSSVTQWAWDFGDGNNSTLQNPTHTYAATGTYTVTLNVTSAIGCQTVNNVATKTVVVVPLPTASFTTSAPVCENTAITFTSTSTANAGTITQYAWTVNSNPTGGNNPSITFTPPASGNYTIQLTIQTDKGCSKSTSTTLIVTPKPAADFTLPNVCMPGGVANFINNSTISDGSPLTYAWDFGDGGLSNAQNPTHTYTSVGPFTVTLVVSSVGGCTDTKVKTLTTIYAEPQAAFNAPPEVCLGSPAAFSDISTAPGSSVTQWAWDFGDGNNSTQQNPTHTYTTAGTYTVTLNVTSAIGCQTVSNFATRTIIVNPLPTSNFNIVAPNCQNKSISFTDASLANAGSVSSWQWDFGDPGSGSNNTSTLQNPTHVYAAPGPYTVTLIVTTNKGCVSAPITKQVVVNQRPSAAFTAPVACSADNAQFTESSSISTGSIVAWDWNFGDPASGPLNTSTSQNPTHQFTAGGSYTTTLIVTSNQGCKDTTTRTFTVNGNVTSAAFTVQNASGLCSNNPVTVQDGATISYGNILTLDIYWDYLNDPTIKTVVNNPVPGATYTHTYPEFGTPFTKNYSVRYVVSSGTNCVMSSTQVITLKATPTIQFDNVPAVCQDKPSFQITQAQVLNGLPGTGVFSGTGVTSTGVFSPSTGPNNYIIRYTFTGTNGCSNYKEQTVIINPTPGVNAGPDKVVLEGGQVMLTPAVNAGVPVTYSWVPPTGLSNPNIPNPIASPLTDATYTLTVTSDQGCSAFDRVFVKVLKSVVIPNIFSPNGDGVHDRWEIAYLESYPGCTVDIYNRYGQLIYHSVGYSKAWDGTINGNPAPMGTYYYIVDPKNGRKKMAGYVDIIR
jgi:gliding motility-associated-like protein